MVTLSIISGLVIVLAGMKFYQYKKKQTTDNVLDATESEGKPLTTKEWLKRLGFAGFMFFFIKGLVWLALFFFAGKSFF